MPLRQAGCAAPPADGTRTYDFAASVLACCVTSGDHQRADAWIVVVDAESPQVEVPRQYVKDGHDPQRQPHRHHLAQDGQRMAGVQCALCGVTRAVRVPMKAVLGIYARETGQGMIFNESDLTPEPPNGKPPPASPPEEGRRPHLKVVK